MESSRRDGYDGYCTWGGALLQPELVGLKAKIGLGGHKATIFIYTIDITYIHTFDILTCMFCTLLYVCHCVSNAFHLLSRNNERQPLCIRQQLTRHQHTNFAIERQVRIWVGVYSKRDHAFPPIVVAVSRHMCTHPRTHARTVVSSCARCTASWRRAQNIEDHLSRP
jgi:hypothetical protein